MNELLRRKIDELSGNAGHFPKVRWLILFGIGWIAITIAPIFVSLQLEPEINDWGGYVA